MLGEGGVVVVCIVVVGGTLDEGAVGDRVVGGGFWAGAADGRGEERRRA